MFFSGGKKIVGLDIDSCEIRAVELSGSAKNPVLETMGKIPLPDGAFDEGFINNPDQVTDALLNLWSEYKIKCRNVILGISNQDVLVRFATFPKVEEKKLGSLIKHQAQDYIPIPLVSVVLDYAITGEFQEESREMNDVLLVAAKRDMLNIFISTFKNARLNLWDIDVSSLVLLKIIPDVKQEGVVVLVDVALGQSNILIAENGMPRLARRITVRLKDLEALLDLSTADMSGFTKNKKFTSDEYYSWSDSLINEIRSSISYYQSKKGALPIEDIYFSGRGALMPGLLRRAGKALLIPVKAITGLINDCGVSVDILNDCELNYALALSLALRGLEG